ncbi:MAG: DUF3455 domain-containing protein [Solirubrobacteraceae bacterium]
MTFSIRLNRVILVGITAAAMAWPLARAAHAGPREPAVPSAIEAPDGYKVFLIGHAAGVHVCACNATSSGFAWTFVAPRANLFGTNGKLIATHFAGPTWQAKDGSTVVGARVNGVTADASAIPWLLL